MAWSLFWIPPPPPPFNLFFSSSANSSFFQTLPKAGLCPGWARTGQDCPPCEKDGSPPFPSPRDLRKMLGQEGEVCLYAAEP